MSWDLVFWNGAPLEDPPQVWDALRDGHAVPFVQPISDEAFRAAVQAEYGSDYGEGSYGASAVFRSNGWEGGATEGGYVYLTCAWGLAKDPQWLSQVVRLGLRAGWFVFDPQSASWWEPPEPGWDPADFDAYATARHLDDG